MSLRQWSISKKGTVISLIQIEELLAYYQHTKFAPLCRINYRSHSIELFSDLWASLEAFDNILKIKISLTYAVLFKLKILHPKPEVYEIDGTFRFQNGLNKLSRIWSNGVKSKMPYKMTFTGYLWRFSKAVVFFSENVVFQKWIKTRTSRKFRLFAC